MNTEELLDTAMDYSMKSKEYWIEKLSGEIHEVNFLTDYIRTEDYIRSEYSFSLDSLSSKIFNITKNNDLSLFVLLLAALKAMHNRIHEQNDIIISSPIYSHLNQRYNYNKLVPFRDYVEDSISFKELLLQVKQTVLDAYSNQFYSIDRVLEEINIDKSVSLYRFILCLENIHDIEHLNEIMYSSKNDIIISISHKDSIIVGKIIYNSLLFNEKLILRISKWLIKIIEQVTDNINIKICELDLLMSDEESDLLGRFNNTDYSYPEIITLYDMFERQVEKTPDKIALEFEDKKLTYFEYNKKANQLARTLRDKGVKPNTVVGVMVERSMEMAIGIMGVLKSGAAYLPIDSTYPKERIDYMLNDSNIEIIVTQKHMTNMIEFHGDKIFIDKEEHKLSLGDKLESVNSHNDLAYIIYTSGTSGDPKGVMIEHRSIVNTIQWRKEEYKLNCNDNILLLFSCSFDGFLTSFFTPLISGSKVVILNELESKNPSLIIKNIANKNITHFICIPTLYAAILNNSNSEELASLRIITLAGERVSTDLIEYSKKKTKNTEIVNEYGPTENCVVTTFCRDLQVKNKISIGKPIANTKVFIVDDKLRLQPIGVPGEICVSGIGLSRGYLNKPELTKNKFILNPFNKASLMYRTGDIGRWLPNGNIEFLGRKDNQVKIRGFRVELSEIENVIKKSCKISDVFVHSVEEPNGNKYICAYYIADNIISASEFKEQVSRYLPQYMIPTYFVKLDKIPLLPNGKVNTKLLQFPIISESVDVNHEKPRNKIEEDIFNIWIETLGKSNFGINDNFLEIGGNSILLMQMHACVDKLYPDKIKVADVFAYSTISKLANYIKS